MTRTNTPTDATPSAREALAAASQATSAAGAAMEAAGENVTAAEQSAADLEAAFVAGDTNITTERIQKAHNDIEAAHLKRKAAEAAFGRACDAEVRAHRAVVAEEYLAEHKAFNDEHSRENVLTAQLTDTVAELIGLIDARQELHNRLAGEYQSWPADERQKLRIPPGRPITTYVRDGLGVWEVQVPRGDVAEAVQAGIALAMAKVRAGY